MTSDGVVHTNLPRNAGTIAKKYGFLWGGDYTGSRKDPMHFEFMGTPADAKRLTKALKKKPTPVVPQPQPPKPSFIKGSADVDWVTVKQGDSGQKVRNIQALLKVRGYVDVNIDGTFGPRLTEKVKHFQKVAGIVQTGNVGPRTMKALLKHNMTD
jgi:peptidoglycan hydrolase-like protein with peptidoglycan-binding domain